VLDRLGIGFQNRPGPIQSRCISARHDAELAIFCTGLSARNRRIDKRTASRPGPFTHVAGQPRRGRGVIDKDTAGRHRLKGGAHDLANILIIADAQDEKLRCLTCPLRRFGHRRAGRLGPGHSLGQRPVVPDDLMSGLDQMPGHGAAHNPQTGEPDPHRSPREIGP